MASSGTINIDLKNIIRHGYKQDGKSGIRDVLKLKIELLRDKQICISELKKNLINATEDFCVVFGEKADFVKGELLGIVINENTKEQLLNKFLLRYLHLLNEDEYLDVKESGVKENKLITQVENYLKTCSVNELKMATAMSLAEKFNVTREHLSRVFKQNHNCSLSKRILKARLDRVFYLLQNAGCSDSIKSIAMSVGITNYTRFKKQFLNRFGFPPKIIKKEE